jgi:hypothetical protein
MDIFAEATGDSSAAGSQGDDDFDVPSFLR